MVAYGIRMKDIQPWESYFQVERCMLCRQKRMHCRLSLHFLPEYNRIDLRVVFRSQFSTTRVDYERITRYREIQDVEVSKTLEAVQGVVPMLEMRCCD